MNSVRLGNEYWFKTVLRTATLTPHLYDTLRYVRNALVNLLLPNLLILLLIHTFDSALKKLRVGYLKLQQFFGSMMLSFSSLILVSCSFHILQYNPVHLLTSCKMFKFDDSQKLLYRHW
jgi:hypothetical protein